ncbi:MAG: DUF4369 domain-containing protein [Bacteroidaceae bacterium]|nr:DUF4369 domain-containing protein [Bacteroidaceae bacterium]
MRAICLFLLSSFLLLVSCTQEYVISGNSDISMHDGKTIYLRESQIRNQTHDIDSCTVQHGRFTFCGNTDTVMMVGLYMGAERVMPMVLEGGDVTIEISHLRTRLSGSRYNEKLNKFLADRNKILVKQDQLRRKCIEMLYRGSSEGEIDREITKPSVKLVKKLEKVESDFIKENFDNALGPGCFMWFFGQYPVPVITPQIQNILDGAPDSFKSHPYIREYIHRAKHTINHQ